MDRRKFYDAAGNVHMERRRDRILYSLADNAGDIALVLGVLSVVLTVVGYVGAALVD